MKPFSLQALATAFLVLATPALAQTGIGLEGMYIGAYGGASFIGEQDVETDALQGGVASNADTNIEYDLGYRFGGHVGYRLNSSIRLQLDISYLSADGENKIEAFDDEFESDQEISILSGTVGAFLDLFSIGTTVPYIGGGIGIAQIEVDNDGLGEPLGDSKQTALTAFGEAGASVDLTPNLAVVPSLRFSWYNTKEEVETGADDFGNEVDFVSIGDGLYETQLLVQARYSF